MKYLLALTLVFNLPPTGLSIVEDTGSITGLDFECTVEVQGSVEHYLKAYYDFEDPELPGERYIYTGPVEVATDTQITVSADWMPVAIEWYYKAYGGYIVTPEELPDLSEGDFILGHVCGAVPSPEYAEPSEGDPGPIAECPAIVEGTVELYARAYYLHESPDNPGFRFNFQSETLMATNEDVLVKNSNPPLGVELWYRPFGVLQAQNEGFRLGYTCGEIPEGPLELGEDLLRIARKRSWLRMGGPR